MSNYSNGSPASRVYLNGVANTCNLLKAIGIAMPKDATLHLFAIGPLAIKESLGIRETDGNGDFIGAIAHVDFEGLIRACAQFESIDICTHIFVYDERESLVEAFDRDVGGSTVSLSGSLRESVLSAFVAAVQ